MEIRDIGNYLLRQIIYDMILIVIFTFFLMVSMIIIKSYTQAQLPPLEQIVRAEDGHIFEAKIFNVCMRRVEVEVNNGKVIIDTMTNRLYYILPFVISAMVMVLMRPILRRIKHILRYML